MFVRKSESEVGKIRNLLAGIFGLEEAAAQRLATLLEYLEGDAFQGVLSMGKAKAQELVTTLDGLEEVKKEPAGTGTFYSTHKKIVRETAEAIFDLWEPLIKLVETTIKGRIASSKSSIPAEESLIIIREKMIGTLQEVQEALPKEKREMMPRKGFFPYPGVEEIRRQAGAMVDMMRDLAQQMTAFADGNAGQLVKGASLRSQAREIKQDADIWATWLFHSGQNYWILPSDEVIERTRRHLQAHLWATRKEIKGLPEDRSEADHPETAYSLDQTEARLNKFLELLPAAEEEAAAVA